MPICRKIRSPSHLPNGTTIHPNTRPSIHYTIRMMIDWANRWGNRWGNGSAFVSPNQIHSRSSQLLAAGWRRKAQIYNRLWWSGGG